MNPATRPDRSTKGRSRPGTGAFPDETFPGHPRSGNNLRGHSPGTSSDHRRRSQRTLLSERRRKPDPTPLELIQSRRAYDISKNKTPEHLVRRRAVPLRWETGTSPSSSIISRPRRDRYRCRLSSSISSLTSSGPLYSVFTGATPQRGSPAAVPQPRRLPWDYCADMTTWSVSGGTSPRASLSM